MRVELHRPEEPDSPVATVRWDGVRAVVECDQEPLRAEVQRAFRPTPVLVDDASHRSLGAHGPVVIEPGDLSWFRAVAQTRVPVETGLTARLVPEVREGGFDPAAAYRSFGEVIDRLTSRSPD